MKGEGLDNELDRFASLGGRGYSAIRANMGSAIAILTAIVAVLVTFTEVGFSGFDLRTLTPTLLVILTASYVIYFSMSEAGERLGKESEEYKEAEAALDKTMKKITGEHIPPLREYLSRLADEERTHRIKERLAARGYSYPEYLAYKSGGKYPKETCRAFKRAERVKRVSIPIERMLSHTGRTIGKYPTTPEGKRLLSTVTALIPSTICTLFTVSVMLGAREGLDATGVIEGLLKLSTLPVAALKGYSGGYSYVKGALLDWMEQRRRLLDAFLQEYDNNYLHSEA